MGPQLEALARQHPKIKLRRIDIAEWGSPVARQCGIRSLPTIWLYEDSRLVTKDRDQVMTRLAALR